jgi:hypothetical protein
MNKLFLWVLIFSAISASAQSDRWQQGADYKMEIDFDTKNHQFDGHQIIIYSNNSPDTLTHLFYHLYFNAFQPGSMMDVRNQQLPDADKRVADRISKLNEDEIGFQKIKWLKKNGKKQKIDHVETILEVALSDPILPGEKCKLEMEFEAQVPIQIRRSGRDNKEGIDYSMTQWYPKLCEYDYQGWHANPYVGREFYGVWGDFVVQITMPGDYTIGASGELLNAHEIAKGFSSKTMNHSSDEELTWHFRADNVHDFAWAADRDYVHTTHKAHDGTMLHFFYQPGEKTNDNWELLPSIMDEALRFINENYGKYPYPVYSFIQGGDGGMEYPMATLITGERPLGSLVGVSVHEWMHSWYQMMMGTNEALYAWMDEGFTSYASDEVMNYLISKKLIPGEVEDNPHRGSILGWANFVRSGLAEPLSVHADHFKTNAAYGMAAYVKGSVFLAQLRYIMGDKAFRKGLHRYYNEWRFKHPNPNDFVRVMEKTSGLELDWYKEYMVNSSDLPDYRIDTIENKKISLSKSEGFPMPLEVVVTKKNGDKICYYIPITLMRGEKTDFSDEYKKVHHRDDWPWVNPTYELSIKEKIGDIESVEIDPFVNYSDANREDNIWPREHAEETEE